MKGYVKEALLPNCMDLVVWGHEHECQIAGGMNGLAESAENQFTVIQPGSTVATSLVEGEAKPAPLFVDNLAATQIAKDPVTANNMKHVARRHFYVREVQELGLIRICWWHGKGNEADALTKALPKARHRSLVKNFFNLDRGLKREREAAVPVNKWGGLA